MKKVIITLFFLFIGSFVVAQSVDRSQYTATTLFDAELWERQGQLTASQKYKATVKFQFQSGTNIFFADLDGSTTKMFQANKRWPTMQSEQRVTIYFTARKSYGSGDTAILDDIDFENVSPVVNSSQNNNQQSTINRSQYIETTLFDVELWEKQGQLTASQKYKATVRFQFQSGANLFFADMDGSTTKMFQVNRRWPTMQNGQRVTIYFTARKSYGSGDTPIIDDIQK